MYSSSYYTCFAFDDCIADSYKVQTFVCLTVTKTKQNSNGLQYWKYVNVHFKFLHNYIFSTCRYYWWYFGLCKTEVSFICFYIITNIQTLFQNRGFINKVLTEQPISSAWFFKL